MTKLLALLVVTENSKPSTFGNYPEAMIIYFLRVKLMIPTEVAQSSAASVLLFAVEVELITGYKRPYDQIAELHRQGFYRARRSPTTGHIILERAHYEAVCGVARQPNAPQVRVPRPKVRT